MLPSSSKTNLALECISTVASLSLIDLQQHDPDTQHLIKLYQLLDTSGRSNKKKSQLLRLGLQLRMTGVKEIDQVCFRLIPRFVLKQGLKYQFKLSKEQEAEIFATSASSSNNDENEFSLNNKNSSKTDHQEILLLSLSQNDWKEIFTSIYSSISSILDARGSNNKILEQEDDEETKREALEYVEAIKRNVIKEGFLKYLISSTSSSIMMPSSLISAFVKLVIKVEFLKAEFHHDGHQRHPKQRPEEDIQYTFAQLLSIITSSSSSSSSQNIITIINDEDQTKHEYLSNDDWGKRIRIEEVIAKTSLVEFTNSSNNGRVNQQAPAWFVLGCSQTAFSYPQHPETSLLVASSAAAVGRWRDAIHHLVTVTDEMNFYRERRRKEEEIVEEGNEIENNTTPNIQSHRHSHTNWKEEKLWNRHEVGLSSSSSSSSSSTTSSIELLLSTAITVSRMAAHDSYSSSSSSSSKATTTSSIPYRHIYPRVCELLGSHFSVSEEASRLLMTMMKNSSSSTNSTSLLESNCDDLLLRRNENSPYQHNNNMNTISNGWIQCLRSFHLYFGGHNFPQSGYPFSRPGTGLLNKLCFTPSTSILRQHALFLQSPILSAVTMGIECLRHDMTSNNNNQNTITTVRHPLEEAIEETKKLLKKFYN